MSRDMFIANYTAWRWQNGLTGEPEIPSLCGMKFDIADLWTAVQSEGGSRRVSEGRRWAAIGRRFNPPATMTNFSHRIKNLFAEYLLEYERVIDPDRAMLKPTRAARNRSSKMNSNSQTLIEDANRCQVSRRPTKRPRSPSISFDQPLPTLDSTPVDQQSSIDLYQEALVDLARAYVHCEGLMKLLHGAIENAKVKAQICHQAYEKLIEEKNTADDGDGDNNRV